MQKIKKTHREDPEKNASQMDEQTDRWTYEQDQFHRAPSTKIEVRYVFWKFVNKIFSNYLA